VFWKQTGYLQEPIRVVCGSDAQLSEGQVPGCSSHKAVRILLLLMLRLLHSNDFADSACSLLLSVLTPGRAVQGRQGNAAVNVSGRARTQHRSRI